MLGGSGSPEVAGGEEALVRPVRGSGKVSKKDGRPLNPKP